MALLTLEDSAKETHVSTTSEDVSARVPVPKPSQLAEWSQEQPSSPESTSVLPPYLVFNPGHALSLLLANMANTQRLQTVAKHDGPQRLQPEELKEGIPDHEQLRLRLAS